MTESINFPNLGIHLEHVGQKISIFGFDIAYYDYRNWDSGRGFDGCKRGKADKTKPGDLL